MRGRIYPLYGLLILPLILLISYGDQFLYLPGAEFSDLTISHLPNAIFLRRALLEWQQIPLWSPGILSGFPFAANPLSGLFYPPGWLAVIWPEAWMFNGLAGLHLVWGGVGMVLLLQKQGLKRASAIFAGLAFAFMPKLAAHYGAGHVTLIYAVSWTPWLLYVSEFVKYPLFNIQQQKPPRYWIFDIRYLPAVILALIFFADVRWAAFAGLLWMAWWFLVSRKPAHSHENLRENGQTIGGRDEETIEQTTLSAPNLKLTVYPFVLQIIVCGMLSAPLAFPLVEFVRLSTRASLGVEDVFAFSLPPARLLGFLFPEFGGMQEWVVYPGMLTLALALLSLVWPEVRRHIRFWWGVWLLATVYALGENIPGITWLAYLPGVSLLRVPSRAMFLAGMAITILAAFSLEHLMKGVKKAEQRRAMRVLVILFGVVSTFSVGVRVLTGDLPFNFVWGSGMAGVTLIGLGWMLGGQRPVPTWVIFVLLGISVLDCGGVTVRSLSPRLAQKIFAEQAEVITFLNAQPGQFRVYSPSYSLPQHIAAKYQIELTDGVDPMQIANYTDFMALASGIPQDRYSVTVPPFEGEVSTANKNYLPDAELLALLNARFVVAEFDIHAQGLTFVGQFGGTRVYGNALARSRGWVEYQGKRQDVPIVWTPNRIMTAVNGPGLLVLSELAYPGWQVWVDGEQSDLEIVEGLLRGVHLQPGEHQVVFSFRPTSLYFGLVLFGIVAVFFIAIMLIKRKPV